MISVIIFRRVRVLVMILVILFLPIKYFREVESLQEAFGLFFRNAFFFGFFVPLFTEVMRDQAGWADGLIARGGLDCEDLLG